LKLSPVTGPDEASEEELDSELVCSEKELGCAEEEELAGSDWLEVVEGSAEETSLESTEEEETAGASLVPSELKTED